MSEETLAAAISPHLIALYRPTDDFGHGPIGHWSVCVGSHGGDGKTLVKAMRACLMCCGLGSWWHLDYGKGELLADFFDRQCREHLGRPIYSTSREPQCP